MNEHLTRQLEKRKKKLKITDFQVSNQMLIDAN